MRVLFLGLGAEQLNVGLLAAICRRAGHTVCLAFERRLFDDGEHLALPWLARHFDDRIVEQAVGFRPDVVCASSLTVTHRRLVAVARAVKEATGAVTVFGGVHPSAVPETVLADPAVDFVCVGEGDVALPLLLDELTARDLAPPPGPLPNLAFRGPDGEILRGPQLPFVQDLDALPGFEKDPWEDHVRVGDWYMTMASRGCPYRCTFCFNSFFAGLGGPGDHGSRYLRRRSVDHFLAELAHAKRTCGLRYVEILDDILTLDTAWLQAFADRYRREIGVPFSCLSHVRFLDAPRARALRDAACEWVQIGIQSADTAYKRRHLRRAENASATERALDLLHAHGLKVKTDHIFGFPGERMESHETALAFYADQPGIRHVSTYWLNYFPGTEMMEAAVASGALGPEEARRIEQGDPAFFDRSASVKDPAQLRAYRDYDLLLRALPYLPASWRGALRKDHAARVPDALLGPLAVLTTLGALAATRNPDLVGYARRYLHGVREHTGRRLRRLPVSPARALGPVADPDWDRFYAAARSRLAVPPPGAPRRRPRRAPAPDVTPPRAAP